jgi:hypothetical protein
MPKKNPQEIFEELTTIVRKSEKEGRVSQEMDESASTLNSSGQKSQILYDRNLHDALLLAEEIDQNKLAKDRYSIGEGWDLHDLLHSLVVLMRAFRISIRQGNVEVATQKQMENSQASLDK